MILNVLERVLAIIILVLLLPLLIIISIFIIMEDGFPVLFVQQRVGRREKSFKMFKFRSMVKHKEQGFVCTKENDKRITKVGKIIRKTRIDEVPQIINIILGDMSFVGVRPDIDSHFTYYTSDEKKEYALYRPGIYGLAAYVYKNEGFLLNNAIDKEKFYLNHLLHQKCNLNKIYNDNKSVLLDIRILLASFHLINNIKINNQVFHIINSVNEIGK